MTDGQGAAKAAPKENVEQEIGYVGARLREKSTYAGLAVLVSIVLPLLSKYFPALTAGTPTEIINAISALGIAIGGIIAVVMPENGSNT